MSSKNLFFNAIEIRVRRGLSTSPEEMLRLRSSIEHETLEILTDSFKKPIGYLVFAKVCKESSLILLNSGSLPMRNYEWREGFSTLITDIVFCPQRSHEARIELVDFLRKQRSILYLRKNVANLWIRKHKIHRKVFSKKINTEG